MIPWETTEAVSQHQTLAFLFVSLTTDQAPFNDLKIRLTLSSIVSTVNRPYWTTTYKNYKELMNIVPQILLIEIHSYSYPSL